MTDDLVAFIRARLDEDEAIAKGLAMATRFVDGRPDFYGRGGPAADAHWDRFTSDRELREVEAKRRIADRHDPCDDWSYGDSSSCPELRDLASIWSNHPDYPR